MNCYYIVLSKDKKLDAKTIRKRLESGFISLELDKKDAIHQPLNEELDVSVNKELEETIQTFLEVKIGDLVLVINNQIPVALVTIKGSYIFQKKLRYQHFYPIKVITYFSDLQDFMDKTKIKHNTIINGVYYLAFIQNTEIFDYHHPQSTVTFISGKVEKDPLVVFYKERIPPEPLLYSIKIENFKSFNSLTISKLKNINLITGKNNAGKTNLLEACYLYLKCQNSKQELKKNIIEVMGMRDASFSKDKKYNNEINITNSLVYRSSIENVESCIRLSSLIGVDFVFPTNCSKKIRHLYNDIYNDFLSNMVSENRIFFITPHLITDTTLIHLFSKIQLLRKRSFLNKAITDNFGQYIEEFDIIAGKPKLYVSENQKGWIACDEFGDGIKRFITILSAIWVCSDGVCFIDEIENGFHYTLHDKLWKLVITASKEANCQLFISSHSAEIIHSFNKTAKELQETDISLIRLSKNKEGDIKPINYDAAMLDNELWQEHEVRGW